MDLFAVRNSLIHLLRPESQELREASARALNMVRVIAADAALTEMESQGRVLIKRVLSHQGTLIHENLDGMSISQAITSAQKETRHEFVTVLSQVIAKGYNLGVKGLIDQIFKSSFSEEALPQYVPGTPFVFGAENSVAKRWIDTEAAKHVTKIDEVTRGKIASLVQEAYDNNTNYSVLRSRILQEIDPQYGMNTVKPQRHIRDRAELIAVTELRNAHEEGAYQGALKMKKEGLIQVIKAWETVGDNRVSPGCSTNSLVGWQPMDYIYPSTGTYDGLRPPRFPGCRCTALYDTDTIRKDVDFTVFEHDGAYTLIQNEPVFAKREADSIKKLETVPEVQTHLEEELGVQKAVLRSADLPKAQEIARSLTIQKKEFDDLKVPMFTEIRESSQALVSVKKNTLYLDTPQILALPPGRDQIAEIPVSIITRHPNPMEAAVRVGGGMQITSHRTLPKIATEIIKTSSLSQAARISPSLFVAENYAAYKLGYGNELPLEVMLILSELLAKQP